MAKTNELQPVETEDPDNKGNREMQRKTGSQEMNRWTAEPAEP
jgi:hypothetical protein